MSNQAASQNTPQSFDEKKSCFVKTTNDTDKIEWSEAVRWAKAFRTKYGQPRFLGNKINGFGMSADNVRGLLTQDSLQLAGIKIYLGLDDQEIFRVIVVAVANEEGDDYNVPPDEAGLGANPSALPIIGEARPCPVWCGTDNVLNSGV